MEIAGKQPLQNALCGMRRIDEGKEYGMNLAQKSHREPPIILWDKQKIPLTRSLATRAIDLSHRGRGDLLWCTLSTSSTRGEVIFRHETPLPLWERMANRVVIGRVRGINNTNTLFHSLHNESIEP